MDYIGLFLNFEFTSCDEDRRAKCQRIRYDWMTSKSVSFSRSMIGFYKFIRFAEENLHDYFQLKIVAERMGLGESRLQIPGGGTQGFHVLSVVEGSGTLKDSAKRL